MSTAIPAPPSWSLPRRLKAIGFTASIIAIFAWAYHGAEIRFGDLAAYSGNMLAYAQGFLQPNFTDWPDFLSEMIVTIHIALWGTLLAIVGAVPLGLMASSNIAPFWVRQSTRRILDVLRSVNELIFAMLFIVAIGLGPFAGVMALVLHNLGVLAKLFSEAVESIDEGPVEGIEATGAKRLEVIFYGVIPQALPLWVSYTLYRFESNVRSASVLGMIGAGGIGMLLWDAIRGFDYSRTAAILAVIIAAVVLIDVISSQLRKRIV